MLTYPQIDPVIFEIGPLAVRWYSMAYVAGIVLGCIYADWLNKKPPSQKNLKVFDDFMTWVVFGIVSEAARRVSAWLLVFATSSSVYGANVKLPFAESDSVDHPVSLYAATNKANELMAHSYAHLYRLPCTGLRFFTVYGPWGRPDMALFKFTKAILAGESIQVFNRGDMLRDFTYVDDIVEGVMRVTDRPAAPDPAWRAEAPDSATSSAPYRIYNIGNSSPVKLMRYIEVLEQCLEKKAQCEMLPMQAGDVPATNADVSRLERDAGYRPGTPVEVGVQRFVEWYRKYYKV